MDLSRWRLACIDLDGTIIRGTSTTRHLAQHLGQVALFDDLERRYANGDISSPQFADAAVCHYAGYTASELQTLFHDVPLIGGACEFVHTLLDHGIAVMICTLSWQFAAQAIVAKLGVTGWCGPTLEVDANGCFTGVISSYFDEFDKRDFIIDYCAKRSITAEQVFAVGDSRSDIPLFGFAGFSVALNGTADTIAAADIAIDSEDIRAVLPLLCKDHPS